MAAKDTKPDAWMYMDAATQQQRGPITEDIVKRLIRKGILAPKQFVWTPRLKEWASLESVEPFAEYCSVWFTYWYYLPDAGSTDQRGPVVTKELVALFVDGEIDGLTLVWNKDMAEWKPIGEIQSLKDFIHEANEDQEREATVSNKQGRVATQDQVFVEESVNAFVAEDGKEYVFDEETKKWVTPLQKIEDDLEALREAAVDDNGNYKTKLQKPKPQPKAPPLPVAQLLATAIETEEAAGAVQPDTAATEDAKRKRKKKKKSEKWQKAKVNTWVYVNGLPLDVTIQEVHDHFSKCGVIQTDLLTETPRIKLYTNKEYGGLNGDASVCYMKEASVELAIQLLDKSQIRPDWKIDVAPAVFQQKGDAFVKRKKQRLDSRAKVKRIEQEKALSWNEGEDGDRAGLRIVVIKHMFTPEEIEDDAYELELKEDIEAECAKIGEVTKITLFSKHVDGVVVIKFASSGSAAKCVDIMNGRFFAGRKLVCHFWDGTDYTHKESKEELQQRAEGFDEWLNGGSSSSEHEEDDDDEEEEEEEEAEVHPGRMGEDGTHAGRVLPDLDDDDGDDSD